jgi:beta-glucosidase/6-phospho-beta-glucosidase/beta-galactosidase
MSSPGIAADPLTVEGGFLWGVSTSAYQSEGGYNGRNQPQTNWAGVEADQEVMSLGNAAEFWTRYPEDFALCRKMGLSAFRLSIEWSRVQPTLIDQASAPPAFDYAALDHYAAMLMACRDHGLEPVVTLHHFTHPAWLGADPWLDSAIVGHYENYVQVAVRHINRVLVSKGYPLVRYYITINEPNMLLFNTYLSGQFPSAARRGFKSATHACCQLLCAHVAAYNSIHDIYQAENWEQPLVTLNNYCSDIYWADKFLLDLLSLRDRQIPTAQVRQHFREKNLAFGNALCNANLPLKKSLSYWFGVISKEISGWYCQMRLDMNVFKPFMDSLGQSRREQVFDYLALDYYDPFTAHIFRPPSVWDHEFQNKSFHSWVMNTVSSKWWDWRVLPRGLHFFCRYFAAEFPGRPVLIAENGMALRRRTDNSTSHRRDKISRSQFLSLHIDEVVRIVREGIPLIGYLHWSLFDNYEWGTYTPRFGLFSIDYQKGADRIPVDHHGDCPSQSYAALIKGIRSRFTDAY